MGRIRRSMTYGNVVATLALFFAVGGGGAAIAAAASTPSTSHGARATIASTRGPRGPRGYRGYRGYPGANGLNGFNGATGPQGPAGSALAWAAVPANGFSGGNGHNVGSITPSGTGAYCVTGITGSPTAAIGSASVAPGATGVVVTTATGAYYGCVGGTQFTIVVYNLSGTAVSSPFYVAFY